MKKGRFQIKVLSNDNLGLDYVDGFIDKKNIGYHENRIGEWIITDLNTGLKMNHKDNIFWSKEEAIRETPEVLDTFKELTKDGRGKELYEQQIEEFKTIQKNGFVKISKSSAKKLKEKINKQ